MALTLAELLRSQTKDELTAKLIAQLQALGLPVTDWNTGSVGRILLEMYAAVLKDVTDLNAIIAAGGYPSLSAALTNSDGSELTEWIRLVAEQFYNIVYASATYTKQRCRLYCETGNGPYVISAGQLVARNPTTGRRYRNVTGGTVPAGPGSEAVNFVALDFQAESPGSAYNGDGVGSITEMVTPLPGLRVTNPQPDIGGLDANSRARLKGNGGGTITPTGAPTGPNLVRSYTITILTGGQVGAGSASIVYTYVDSVTQQVVSVAATVTPIADTTSAGIAIDFANGPASPSFIAGDVYTFSTPGSPIIQSGSDEESNASLLSRCQGRWPSLSLNPTDDKIEAWVKQCSIDGTLGITKIKVGPSTTQAGYADVIIATSSGAPPGATVTAVQDYLNARDGVSDKATVAGAVNKNINLSGSVTVKSSKLVEAKAAADVNWQAYLASLDIGGDTSGIVYPNPGVARLSELVQAVMDAGAVDYGSPSPLQLNGAATNVSLLYNEVAVIPTGQLPSEALTWLPVP